MKKNKLIIYFFLFNILNCFGQNNNIKVVSNNSIRPLTIIIDSLRNTKDTIIEAVEGTTLLTYKFDTGNNECAIIHRSDEGDRETFWYFFYTKGANNKWVFRADSGIGVRVYRKNQDIYSYDLVNTRLINVYNNKREIVSTIKVNDDFKIKFEPKRN